MTDVTIRGVAGATVTIPFSSADNYVLAQFGAAPAIGALPDAQKFVATSASAVSTNQLGIASSINGANITGTANNASVIASGSNVQYVAGGGGQAIFFAALGTGNVLVNGGGGNTFNIDAGGSSSLAGTTFGQATGDATVNAYSGFLDIVANAPGLRVNDLGAALRMTALGNGGDASIFAAGKSVPTPQVTITGTGAQLRTDVGAAVQFNAGSSATLVGYGNTDTVTAIGAATLQATAVQAIINQTGAGDLSVSSNWAGHATVNAAPNATETISYAGFEGMVLNAGTGDHITLNTGSFVSVNANGADLALTGGIVLVNASGSDTVSKTGGGYASITGAGSVMLNGGTFYTDTVPALSARGSNNIVNSQSAISIGLLNGGALTVQGYPFIVPTDTVTAAGSGTVFANGASAVVSQTGQGNLLINEGYGGVVTVNAASGATENLAASTTPGVAVTYNLNGGNFNITGNRPTVNASGNDTISFTGPSALDAVIVNAAAGSNLDLVGGRVHVSTAGAGAHVTFGGADTITFDSIAMARSVLGATSATLDGGSGSVFNDAVGRSGTYLVTGNDLYTSYFVNPGATSNVVYAGTPYKTAWNGSVVESFARPDDFVANNVVWSAGSGSSTVFGGGDAFGFGVLATIQGGSAGNNLLVGGREIDGGGAGDTLQAGAFTTLIKASNNNTTLIGGDGSFNGSTNFAPAAESLVGGSAADTFVFGTGAESLTGGAGADLFTDINRQTAGTTIAITDFTTGSDKVQLFSVTNASLSGATANVTGQTHGGSDTFVALSDGVTIRFVGVGSVTSSDFVTNSGSVEVGKIT